MSNKNKNERCNNCSRRPFQCPADYWDETGTPIEYLYSIANDATGLKTREVYTSHCFEQIGYYNDIEKGENKCMK
jgi:hypothetical protein